MSRSWLVAVLLVAVPRVPAASPGCAGAWSTRSPMGLPRQEIGVAAIGTTLYAVGGFDADGETAHAEAYDTILDRWTPIAPLPIAVHHPGAAAVGDRLYVVGGLGGASFTAVDNVFAYDPAADSWEPRAPLPATRGAMGIAVVGGRIFAAGGFRNGGSVGDFAVYDPTADAWTVLPPMPTARDHLAAAAIDGRFYAVGGRANGQLFAALEAFDPATGLWRTDLARMPTPRGGLMAAAVGTRLVAFGGEGNPDDPLGVFHQTEAYDAATDRWTALEEMPTARHGSVAAAIDGAIYVPGGASRQGLGVSAVTEVFVPPGANVIGVRQARLRGTRLRLRGRLDAPAGDPASLPLALRLADGQGSTLAELTLPAGALVPRRGRLVFEAPADTTGVRRLTLVRRRAPRLGLRLAVALARRPDARQDVVATLELGETRYCGEGRLRR